MASEIMEMEWAMIPATIYVATKTSEMEMTIVSLL